MGNHTAREQTARPKRTRYHHGDLRRDLLRAAAAEIAEKGASGVSLASLARSAGVAQSAPYRHFADRKALLEALAADGFAALTEAMRAAVAGRPPSSSAEDAMARAYVGFGEANIELYRLMFASRLTPEASEDSALAHAANDAFDVLRTVIAAMGDGRSGDVDIDVYQSWARVHGLVMLKADGFIAGPVRRYL